MAVMIIIADTNAEQTLGFGILATSSLYGANGNASFIWSTCLKTLG
jgi:hypothetical protein